MVLCLPKGPLSFRDAEINLAGINLQGIRITLPRTSRRLFVIISICEDIVKFRCYMFIFNFKIHCITPFDV